MRRLIATLAAALILSSGALAFAADAPKLWSLYDSVLKNCRYG
jgi:hypothetical protein